MRLSSMKSKKKLKIEATSIFEQKNISTYLSFSIVTLIMDIKLIIELLIDWNFEISTYILVLLLGSIHFSFGFFLYYLEKHYKGNPKNKKLQINSLLIFSTIFHNFALIFFRLLFPNSNFSLLFWDSQFLCFFSLIFLKNFCFREKIIITIIGNLIAMGQLIFYCRDGKEIIVTIIAFFQISILMVFVNKDFVKSSEIVDPNINNEEIYDFFQGFAIISKDDFSISKMSLKFSLNISNFQKYMSFNEVNEILHDFVEQKILVGASDDHQSILLSLRKNTSNFLDFFKQNSNFSFKSKKNKFPMKFHRLRDVLEASNESFEMVLKKKILRSFIVGSHGSEKKELYIKNVIYKGKQSYFITIDDLHQINILSNLSKENEFQSRLLSSFSHQMRTPLNGSIPILEDVLESLKPCCKDCFEENIFIALSSLKILGNTINDIVDFQALYSDEFYLNIQEINLKNIFEDVISLMKIQAERKGLHFITKIDDKLPEFIMSDSNRIKQLLLNILNNAIKFTFIGFVEFNATIKMCFPEVIIQVQIKDSGIGIEAEKIEKMQKILNEFQLEKNQFLETTGCSFGLILSHNLAMALGTEGFEGLKVESKSKEGTCFTFYIIDRVDQRALEESKEIHLNTKGYSLNALIKINEKSNEEKNITALLVNDKLKGNPYNEENINSFSKSLPQKSFTSINSPQLKKLRETTYSKIKTSVAEENIDENFEDTPLYYLSQNIIMMEKFTPKNKHFFNDSAKKTIKTETQDLTIKTITNPLAQFSASYSTNKNDCVCNKILVADDSIFNIKTMELLLNKEGFKVDSVFDGDQAIEKFKKKFISKISSCGPKCVGYRLILMDYQMPNKDGVEATIELQALMQQHELKEIPIICCTAFDTSSMVAKCFQAGMKEVIFKPISITMLRNVIKKWYKK